MGISRREWRFTGHLIQTIPILEIPADLLLDILACTGYNDWDVWHLLFASFLHVSYIEHRESELSPALQLLACPFNGIRSNILDSQSSEASTNTKLAMFQRSKLIIFGLHHFWVQAYPWKWKYSCLFWAPKKNLTISPLCNCEMLRIWW